jgi:hypothetical protein
VLFVLLFLVLIIAFVSWLRVRTHTQALHTRAHGSSGRSSKDAVISTSCWEYLIILSHHGSTELINTISSHLNLFRTCLAERRKEQKYSLLHITCIWGATSRIFLFFFSLMHRAFVTVLPYPCRMQSSLVWFGAMCMTCVGLFLALHHGCRAVPCGSTTETQERPRVTVRAGLCACRAYIHRYCAEQDGGGISYLRDGRHGSFVFPSAITSLSLGVEHGFTCFKDGEGFDNH